MGSLIHPVGPRSAAVYWIRRGAVLVVAAVVVVGLLALIQPQPSVPAAGGAVSASASPVATSAAPPATSASASSPTAAPSSSGPPACDATNTELKLSGFQQVKVSAKQTSFKVAVTNVGEVTCALDLKADNFDLKIVSGTDRIWTTDDCAKWVPAKKTKLAAAKKYEFSIDWPVKRSSAGCKVGKKVLGTGTYQAIATFAADDTAKTVFRLVAAA